MNRHRHNLPIWAEHALNVVAAIITFTGVTTAGLLTWNALADQQPPAVALLAAAGASILGSIPGLATVVAVYRYLP